MSSNSEIYFFKHQRFESISSNLILSMNKISSDSIKN